MLDGRWGGTCAVSAGGADRSTAAWVGSAEPPVWAIVRATGGCAATAACMYGFACPKKGSAAGKVGVAGHAEAGGKVVGAPGN